MLTAPAGPSACWSLTAPAAGEYTVEATPYLNGEAREPMVWRFRVTDSGLTSEHEAIQQAASMHAPATGTDEWGMWDVTTWKLSGGNEQLFEFKRQWVAGYRDTIRQAAEMYDLPIRLIAGVAFAEVGGDPLWVDPVADGVRSAVGSQEEADRTSYGNVSIQVRRAAEAMGYEPQGLSDAQRGALVDSLQDPRQNILIAAAHLNDLRDVDFPGRGASELGDEEISVIATRYNRGAEVPLEEIRRNLSYGEALLRHADELDSLFAAAP